MKEVILEFEGNFEFLSKTVFCMVPAELLSRKVLALASCRLISFAEFYWVTTQYKASSRRFPSSVRSTQSIVSNI